MFDEPNRVVTIRVTPEGEFVYEPAVLRVALGSRITWRCPDGEFVVSFGPRTPLEGVVEVASTRSKEDDFWASPPQAIDLTVRPGVFSYSVAVATPNGVRLDAFCPSVIVRR
jgi:plastocyanin